MNSLNNSKGLINQNAFLNGLSKGGLYEDCWHNVKKFIFNKTYYATNYFNTMPNLALVLDLDNTILSPPKTDMVDKVDFLQTTSINNIPMSNFFGQHKANFSYWFEDRCNGKYNLEWSGLIAVNEYLLYKDRLNFLFYISPDADHNKDINCPGEILYPSPTDLVREYVNSHFVIFLPQLITELLKLKNAARYIIEDNTTYVKNKVHYRIYFERIAIELPQLSIYWNPEDINFDHTSPMVKMLNELF